MRDLGLKFRYWQTYFRQVTKNQISNDILQKCATNALIPHSPKSKEQITSELCKLRTAIREMKKRHIELREEMLQELAEEYAINNNRDATKVIKEIIATEQIKKNIQKYQVCPR